MNDPITTVYIGGGTPSLLPAPVFRKLLKGLREIYGFDNVKEFSCEANPGTVTNDWLICAAENGINRLSIGMQAFQDDLLKVLGRIHHYDSVFQSVQKAHEAGIHNINLDLIFGIPGQTILQWSETLEKALSLHPAHISVYGLILEEGTPLFHDIEKGILYLPEPDTEREMYDIALKQLKLSGLIQYEISNFAVPGKECSHNIGYWSQIPYIGLGVSAASMINVKLSADGVSYLRKKNPDSYLAYKKTVLEKTPCHDSEIVQSKNARFETMMLGLRMNKGVSEELFVKMHGISVREAYGNKLFEMVKAGLLLYENGYWKMTRRGFDIQNTLLVELMED